MQSQEVTFVNQNNHQPWKPLSDLPSDYEDRYVAFLDVLGFKNLVLSNASLPPNALWALRQLQVSSVVPMNQQPFITGALLSQCIPTYGITSTAFSDCIVLSNMVKNGPDSLLEHVRNIYCRFLDRKLLLCGAVVRGKAIHEQGVVFGPAIIEAYELQIRKPIYPRIVVTESVTTEASRPNADLAANPGDGMWFRESDDATRQWWIDPFRWKPDDAERYASTKLAIRNRLELTRRWIAEELVLASGQQHFPKFDWLAAVFNQACDEFKINDIERLSATHKSNAKLVPEPMLREVGSCHFQVLNRQHKIGARN